jgi:hypothetical protein
MTWSCSVVRRRLAEYHDGELTIEDRVGVQTHLRSCTGCRAESEEFGAVGPLLRASVAERAHLLDSHDLDGLASGVVSRLKAEDDESLPRTFERMFEDLHLVWAALGGAAATLACLAITVGLIYFCNRTERPDSLAAIIDALSSEPVQMDARTMTMPRPSYYDSLVAAPPPVTHDEELWALNTTITKQGRVIDVELISSDPAPSSVMDGATRSRFEPARYGDAPVAVKMVWLFAHLTVRPKIQGTVAVSMSFSLA